MMDFEMEVTADGEEREVPASKRLRLGDKDTPVLMDRSGIVRSSFVRQSFNRGQMPTELVGRAYKNKLNKFLRKTAAAGPVWREREAKWPEQQISEQLAASKDLIEFEVTPDELARIEFYLTQDIRAEDVEQLPNHLWQRVMDKTNSKFTQDARLHGLLRWLKQRAESDWDRGSREALLREALLDPWQQRRLQVRSLPPAFPRFVVTGPAPWAREGQVARQFCKTSLMAASSVVLTMHPIWEKALGDKMEILPVNEISEFRPFYLNELENKVTNYLTSSRRRILHYLFLCAEHMWVHQKQWEALISRQQGVSEDMVRLMNCLSALVSRRLREKTLDSKAAWKHLLLSLKESSEENPVKPIIKFRLDSSTQLVRDDMERAKSFVATTFLRIFEVTRELPSVGTLMFNPDHKFKNPTTDYQV